MCEGGCVSTCVCKCMWVSLRVCGWVSVWVCECVCVSLIFCYNSVLLEDFSAALICSYLFMNLSTFITRPHGVLAILVRIPIFSAEIYGRLYNRKKNTQKT